MGELLLITVGLAAAFAAVALAVRALGGREQPTEIDAERALEQAMSKLSARLDALAEPRPLRARVAHDLDGHPSFEGEFDVPPRARVFSRFNTSLHGRMMAFHQRPHPTDGTLTLQLDAPYQAEAVVYDASGSLVWAPEGACDLAFRRGGAELIEVGSIYQHGPDDHQQGTMRIESPLQSEFTWFVALHEWPSRTLLSQWPISFPQGWAVHLSLSPDERRACIVYIDQCEGGVLVVDLEGDAPRAQEPMFQRYTNLLGTPAWSPSSDCVAVTATANPRWWRAAVPADDTDDVDEDPRALAGAVGGRVLAAYLFVQDLTTNESIRHELELDLPAGWGAGRAEDAVLRAPEVRFVDDETLEVTLLHGPPVVMPRRRRVA